MGGAVHNLGPKFRPRRFLGRIEQAEFELGGQQTAERPVDVFLAEQAQPNGVLEFAEVQPQFRSQPFLTASAADPAASLVILWWA